MTDPDPPTPSENVQGDTTEPDVAAALAEAAASAEAAPMAGSVPSDLNG